MIQTTKSPKEKAGSLSSQNVGLRRGNTQLQGQKTWARVVVGRENLLHVHLLL